MIEPRIFSIFACLLPTIAPACALAQTAGDFNGDGSADLVIGVPHENIGDRISAGAVHVIYGSAERLTGTASDFWHQSGSGMLDDAELDDRFGAALAAGDFNGDGFDDLAIGAPGEDLGGLSDVGAVTVLYGSPSGLRTNKTQFWHQDSPGIKDVAEEGDAFGFALAAGDFDDDGYGDLAIGAPGEDRGDAIDAGMIHIIYGSSSGLHRRYNQTWWQGKPGVLDATESGDRFGASLVAAYLTGDRFADLAVGVPGQVVNGFVSAGMVHVFRGSASRIKANGNRVWTQDSPGILDDAEEGDQFGFALAAGDFNDDGRFDLVIGVPFEDIGEAIDAGAVQVMYSKKSGPVARDNEFWHQDVEGMPESAEERDWFGYAIAAGDFNRDGFDDLAIGSPYESIGEVIETGCVITLHGSASRLSIEDIAMWQQESPGLPGQNSQWDNFGGSLLAADFNGDGRADLAIGVPGDDLPGVIDAGSVSVLYARGAGLRAKHNQIWHQDSPGIANTCEDGDYFGHTVSH